MKLLSRLPGWQKGVMLLVAVAMLAWIAIWAFSPGKKTVKIAYVELREDISKENKLTLTKLIEEYNSASHSIELSLDPHELDILRKETSVQKIKNEVEKLYTKISEDPKIVCVLDFTWERHIRHARDIIVKNKLPVICLNADKAGVNYDGHVVFAGGAFDDLPEEIFQYLEGVYKKKAAIFISEKDYHLDAVFHNQAARNMLTLNTIELPARVIHDSTEHLYLSWLNEKIDMINSCDSTDRNIIINTHGDWGKFLVKGILQRGRHCNILTSRAAIGSFNPDTLQHQDTTNYLYVASTLPADALPKKMTMTMQSIKQKWGDSLYTRQNSLDFLKWCFDGFEVVQYCLKQGAYTRNDFIDRFGKIKNKYFEGTIDLYRFDERLLLKKGKNFIQYHNNQKESAPFHLNKSKKIIPNIYVGVDIQNIYDIDINRNSFWGDFYFWIRVDKAHEEMAKYIDIMNMKEKDLARSEIYRRVDKNMLNITYKISGEFYTDFEKIAFPFDEHEIEIKIQSLVPTYMAKVSFDTTGIYDKLNNHFLVPDWDHSDFFVSVDNLIKKSNHKNTLQYDPPYPPKYKVLRFGFAVERKLPKPLFLIILPLILIGSISCFLFLLKDLSLSDHIGLLLTIVAYSISLSSIAPNSDGPTYADWYFIITLLCVTANFIIAIKLKSNPINYSKRHVYLYTCLYLLLFFSIPPLITNCLFSAR